MNSKFHKKNSDLIFEYCEQEFGKLTQHQHNTIKKLISNYVIKATKVYSDKLVEANNALEEKNKYINIIQKRGETRKHTVLKKVIKKFNPK